MINKFIHLKQRYKDIRSLWEM